jgi:hypothetical protein
MKIFIPQERIKKTQESIEKVLKDSSITSKELQRITGTLSSMRLGIRGVSTWTRELYKKIAITNRDKDDFRKKYKAYEIVEIKEELMFWQKNLQQLSKLGREILHTSLIPKIEISKQDNKWKICMKLPHKIENISVNYHSGIEILQKASKMITQQQENSHWLLALDAALLKENKDWREIVNWKSKRDDLNTQLKTLWTQLYTKKTTFDYKWYNTEEEHAAKYNFSKETNNEINMAPQEWQQSLQNIERQTNLKFTSEWKLGHSQNLITVLHPDWNNITNIISKIRECEPKGKKLAIITPKWQAALWWIYIQEKKTDQWVLNKDGKITLLTIIVT